MIPAPIDSPPRTTCLKCGCKTSDNPAENTGVAQWCVTCRWLLVTAGNPNVRYGQVMPDGPTMLALGLPAGNDFNERQRTERIPTVVHVEDWPELPVATMDSLRATFDSVLRRAA